MKVRMLVFASLLPLAGCTTLPPAPFSGAQTVTITVRADQPGAKINPAMWGIFFEDINFGADGGLYAELVKNRGFEFPEPMMGWFKIMPSNARGQITLRTDNPYKLNTPQYLRIASTANPAMGISNEGFRGMGMKGGDRYDFTAQMRLVSGNPRVSVEIVADDGTTLASTQLSSLTGNWTKITATLIPNVTDSRSRLNIIVEGQGVVDVDNVSLFPQKTWMNRPGGLRADMVQALADLKPGFLRFPGGCIVEGSILDYRYQWKNTIGPVEDRPLLINRWNYEFKHRPTPDYYQTFGLGFFEYFQLAEDIGAQPLPILNCGMACQFNSGELVPLDQLDPYIQDALDLIEFANGPATSTWGAKRAAMGHPAPFNMKMIGIGNEQWGQQYIDRLEIFTRRLKAVHPEIQIVSGAGPSPQDERFHYLMPRLQALKADIVDEHCYANPLWFYANSDRYDSYDRNGPKVFFGEYAVQTDFIVSTKNRNTFGAALAEAAFLTGVERNADIVRLASYAPLFAHVDAWQWTPDLIWVDNLRTVRTANYYVQQLYSTHRGDTVIPVTNDALVRHITPAGRIGVGTYRTSAEFKDVRVTRGEQVLMASSLASDTAGWSGGATWRIADGAYLQSDPGATVNSLAGDADWRDYTLTLKARKRDGAEGFVITVCDDGAGAWARWILGGWNNTQHGIVTCFAQQEQFLNRVPARIETDRWYDVKIVVQGAKMECYLDGVLVQSAEILHHRVPTLYTSATRDDQTGELILKVINAENHPAAATIRLEGLNAVHFTGQAVTLSGSLADENTLENPDAIVPNTTTIRGIWPTFQHTFKPQSMTVLRLRPKTP